MEYQQRNGNFGDMKLQIEKTGKFDKIYNRNYNDV